MTLTANLTGQPPRVPLFAWVAVALLVLAGVARADEKEDRDRKARAALALSAPIAVPKAVATAPAPKAKSVAYGDAYKRASAEQQPLVVYVGTPMEPVPGAVVSWTDSFGDTKGPAVVVGYPVGDRLYVHATLRGAPTAEAVQREVKAAAKKADPKPMPPREVKDAPAPQPLDWHIRHEAPRDARTELDVLRDSFVRVRTDRFGGSGVVAWSEPGRSLVFTCWHVVNDGSPIVVRTGGRSWGAKLIDWDKAADVALLEVPSQLPHVAAVESDAPAVGDEALMLGGSSIWSRGKVIDTQDANGRPSASGDFEGYSGDSGGPVFCRGSLVGIVRGIGKDDGHAKFSTRVGPMLVRAINREPVAPKGTPAAVAQPGPKPAALPDCPSGNCSLKPATYAAPVTLPAAGCAGGNCPLPSYQPARGGLFRRW